MIFDVFISPFAFCGISNTITKYILKKTHSGLEKWGETGEETIDSKTHAKKKKKVKKAMQRLLCKTARNMQNH